MREVASSNLAGSTPLEVLELNMHKKTIKIAGAGLAGLTCAINLAKAGQKVEIYEKCPQVGGHYPENPQLLPNWFCQQDVVEEIEGCNIRIGQLRKIEEAEIYIDHRQVIIKGNRVPVGYVVLRGGDNSFENHLLKQAEELGVDIKRGVAVDFQKILEEKDDLNQISDEARENNKKVDVIATGISKPITHGYGQAFKGSFEANKVKVFLKKDFSPSIGYGYFFPHNSNVATIKISRKIGEEQVDLERALEDMKKKYFKKSLKENNFLYDFRTKRSFGIPGSAVKNNMLLVGEAAGFQDELFRFGMRYAIISGFLAARSIIEGLDYDFLWKERFLGEFQKLTKTRKIFEDLKKEKFRRLPRKLEYVEMDKFKKLWPSIKYNVLLNFYPFYKRFLLNPFFSKPLLRFLKA